MVLSLLKPVHGWRAFLGEIAIVVIGVLIALGAQQVVEDWNWRQKVDDAERRLRREASINFRYAAEQVAVGPCLDAQLERLRQRVLASGASLQPAPVFSDSSSNFVFRAPSRPYQDNVWRAINDDGTPLHFDELIRYLYSQTYTQLDEVRLMTRQSDAAIGRLMVLNEPISLDPATRAQLLLALAEQRGRSRQQSLIAQQVMGTMRDLGQTPAGSVVDQYLDRRSGSVRFCRGQRLPLADWRKELGKVPALTFESLG
jgi:hypothetical protein